MTFRTTTIFNFFCFDSIDNWFIAYYVLSSVNSLNKGSLQALKLL